MIERVRLVIAGRVQGVGFRYSAMRRASSLGLTGWVRNLPDGRVEAEIMGERASIEAMLAWCAEGPPGARVDAVDIAERDAGTEAGGGFEIR